MAYILGGDQALILKIEIPFLYPLFCTGLAISKITLDRLRDGTVDRIHTNDVSLTTTINELYVKLFKKLHDIW